MDAVLPLIARDLPRFELLLRSLRRYVTGLDRLLVVVPERELSQMQLRAARGGPALRMLSERALVPELSVLRAVPGWYRQQLVKLAAAEHVDSAFYLTLDADVIATRAVDLNALCAGGTAPCGVAHGDWHPRWYEGAEALLGARLPRRGISHAVTPTFLHRAGVRALTAHLDRRWQERAYSPGLRGIKQRLGRCYVNLTGSNNQDLRAWRILLCCSRPWSEYSLYFSFLEWRGLFEVYHHETPEGLYANQQSIWLPADVASWDPARIDRNAPPFIVLQSTAGIPLDTLHRWLDPLV